MAKFDLMHIRSKTLKNLWKMVASRFKPFLSTIATEEGPLGQNVVQS